MALLIEDYALLSDCNSAALVGKNGSIDWLCLPSFDSAACFAALLGDENNGRWLIAPKGEFHSRRQYVDGTTVLETTFESSQGLCRLTDCMLVKDETPTLVRILEGLSGEVDVQMEFVIRFDYGSIVPWVRRLQNSHQGIRAIAGPEAIALTSAVPLKGKDLRTVAEFKVKAGEQLPFVLQWYPSHKPEPYPVENPYVAVRKTIYWWKEWSDRCQHDSCDRAGVKRSLITLKALTYAPTGGIVAAPTTSLPESIGSNRNWDYRFSWIRDSTFTLYALLNAGYRDEAQRWNMWLLRAVAGTPSQVNIMYGINGERRLTEVELDWLAGYQGSKPVRIGNAAYKQMQIDVFGELMDTRDLARRSGLYHDENSWRIEKEMLKYLCQNWASPDEGIWEIRGPRRHFTHSKVMAWVAVDRAVRAVQNFGMEGPMDEWIALRDKIHRDVCENGFDRSLNSFVQSYGSKELDASLLMISLVGFLPPDDPRSVGTVNAIQKNLMQDGLVLRYRTHPEIDGLPSGEGSFLACTFWLIDNLVLLNRRKEAEEFYKNVVSLRNDVGLFSEEYSMRDKRMLGNFPQALSHIAHVNSASNLWTKGGPASDRSASA